MVVEVTGTDLVIGNVLSMETRSGLGSLGNSVTYSSKMSYFCCSWRLKKVNRLLWKG